MWKYVAQSHWVFDEESGQVICSNVLNAAAGETIAQAQSMREYLKNRFEEKPCSPDDCHVDDFCDACAARAILGQTD